MTSSVRMTMHKDSQFETVRADMAPVSEEARSRRTDPEFDDSLPTPSSGTLAPTLAKALVGVVLGGFLFVAFLRILFSFGPGHVVLCVALMAFLLSVHLLYFARPGPMPTGPVPYLLLLADLGAAYLPVLAFGEAWIGIPGFVAGAGLLVLPLPIAWTGVALVVASVGAMEAHYTGGDFFSVAYASVSTVIISLIVYGLTRLSTMVVELYAARRELAKMAVAQERLRFARDLHDLLGYSLSAITLKSELTRRLVVTHPVRAQEELVELLEISRRALADVRSVASGYRELSLDTEARSARSVLLAADVDAQVHLDYGELPAHVRTLLATVLREGVTNVLRHSKAENCEITVRQERTQVVLEIVNDGADEPAIEDAVAGPTKVGAQVGGSGIGNLSARLAAVGGTLHAGPDPDGRWRLRAAVKL